jgi:hypothetical protein
MDSFSKNTQMLNFRENPSSRSRVVSRGRTDGKTHTEHDEANGRFSQFCERF